VVIERSEPDVGAIGDLPQPDAFDALLGDERGRGCDQALARLLAPPRDARRGLRLRR